MSADYRGIHNANCEIRTPCVFPNQVQAYVIGDHVKLKDDLQNKTAVPCGKMLINNAGDVLTLHLHKKNTKAPQPVKIKAKACANKCVRYIS